MLCASAQLSNDSLEVLRGYMRDPSVKVDAATITDNKTPLHFLCANPNCSIEILELMLQNDEDNAFVRPSNAILSTLNSWY